MSRVARSFLFVPGNRPDRFQKAMQSGAHEVVLDLEDAVSPQAKDEARQMIRDWLNQGARPLVRINAVDTPWYQDDVAMIQSVPGAGIMLAKADELSVKQTVAALPGRRLLALLETVAGYMTLPQLAATPGVERIAFGSIDFSADSGIADEADAMTAIRTNIVLASRYAGLLAPVDGVSTELTDETLMVAAAKRAKQLGFGGKLCIHPRQVAAVHQAYQPSPTELDWAQRVLDAFQASAGGAVAVDGKMVDKPVVSLARDILASGGALEQA